MSNQLSKTYFGSVFPNSILNDFDSIFTPLTRHRYNSNRADTYDRMPRANIYFQENEGYSVELAVPGYSRDDFEIDVDSGVMTVALNGTVENTNTENQSINRRQWFSGILEVTGF